jgi:site-specific DNA-cytosine methylase
MKILIACEFSGIVREAFRCRGHDVLSCDLLESEIPGPHYVGDVRDVLYAENWEMLIAHPPCTHLAVSGARWFKDKQQQQEDALDFVRLLLDAPVDRICLENPVSIISTRIRKPDQIIQPWMFGDPYQKTTCLWLKNLPPLLSTKIMHERDQKCWKEPPGVDRWKKRSRTYNGIATAMAEQWG